MSAQIIEGTWEEIKSHESELIGRHLRVIITPEAPTPSELAEGAIKPKVLRGYGMFAGLLSTEDYLREKREDMIREDRDL